VKILSVGAKNFMSFAEMEHAFREKGLIFVGGEVEGVSSTSSNGAGKSALFEALCWGLYGKTLRGSAVGDVVRRESGKDCQVTIAFEADDGKDYIILRHRDDQKYSNSLFLFSGDSDITAGDSKTTQEEIERLVGMSWAVFSSAVVFGEKAQRFAEARDSEKKAIFDEILLLHRFADGLRVVRDDLKALRDSRSRLRSDLDYLSKSLGDAMGACEEAEKGVEAVDAERRAVQERVSSIEKEKEALSGQLVKETANLEALEEELTNLHSTNEALLEDVLRAEKQKTQLVTDSSGPLLHKRVELGKIDQDVDRLRSKLRSLGQLRGKGSCPTCGQALKKESVETVSLLYKKEIEELSEKRVGLEKEVSELMEKEKEARAELGRASSRAIRLKSEADKALREKSVAISRAVGSVKSIEGRISALEADVGGILQGLDERESFWVSQLERHVEKIAEIDDQMKTKGAEVEVSIEEEKYLLFWEVALGNAGLKSFLLDEILPSLNDRVSFYISALLGEETRIVFDTESQLKGGGTRDKFDVQIFRGDDRIDYAGCSGGEKRRLDVAILLALQSLIYERSASSCNLVVLDEVFDALDRVGVERVVNLLNEEAREKAIYVISHISEFRDYFENEVLIRKEGGESRIVD